MKRLIIICFFLVSCISFNSYCQIQSALQSDFYKSGENKHLHCQHYYNNINKKLLSASDFRPYNVINYNLYLDWYNILKDSLDDQNRVWNGVNTITLVVDSAGTNVITLDAAKLKIQSICINSTPISNYKQPDSTNLLNIPLPSAVKQGDTLVIAINYQHTDTSSTGFFLNRKGKFGTYSTIQTQSGQIVDSTATQEKTAHTDNEPEDARYWMPANDRTNDKATAQITIKVPTGYTAASNGLLKNKIVDDSSETYVWNTKHQIATYLMAVAASKFKEFSDWYVNSNGDSIEIQYYIWDQYYKKYGIDTSKKIPIIAYQNVPAMMKIFSNSFIEYPFEKYGMVSLSPYGDQGMENQTITFIDNTWLFFEDEEDISHELAHQWLGDYTTCGTWKDIWINEGGATWSQTLWNEKFYGSIYGVNDLYYIKQEYLDYGGSNLPAIYDLPINDIFNTGVTYDKACWVYAMLRSQVGDEKFFPALRKFLNTYAQRSAVTADVEQFWHNEIPDFSYDLTQYFEQWLKYKGHPIYQLNSIINKIDNSHYVSHITISQIQSGNNIPPVFTLNVPVIISNSSLNKTQTFVFTNTERIQTFDVTTNFIPNKISIDDSHILCQLNGSYTSVPDEAGNEVTANIYPNPVKAGEECSISIDYQDNDPVQVSIYDILGNKIEKNFYNSLIAGKQNLYFNTRSLSAGTYFIKVFSNHSNQTYKLTVID